MKNKSADQLCSYLCLCFWICKNQVFSRRGSYESVMGASCINIKIQFFYSNYPLKTQDRRLLGVHLKHLLR